MLQSVYGSVNSLLNGQYTARSMMAFTNFIGLSDYHVIDLIQKFVFVPVPTNVYTFVHAPYRDFGSLFPIYHLVLGMLLGFVYTLRSSHFGYRALQAFLFYPLIFSFFQDQFFTLTSQWAQITFSLMLLSAIHWVSSRTVIPVLFGRKNWAGVS